MDPDESRLEPTVCSTSELETQPASEVFHRQRCCSVRIARVRPARVGYPSLDRSVAQLKQGFYPRVEEQRSGTRGRL
jgi:hypothetical protein